MRSGNVLLAVTGAGLAASSALPHNRRGGSDLVQGSDDGLNLTGMGASSISSVPKLRSGSINSARKASTDARIAGLTNLNLTRDRGSSSGMLPSRAAIPSGSPAPRMRSFSVNSIRRSSKSEGCSASTLAQGKDIDIDTESRLELRGVVGGSTYDPGPMSNHAKNVAVIASSAIVGGIALSGAAIYGARRYYTRRQKKRQRSVVG